MSLPRAAAVLAVFALCIVPTTIRADVPVHAVFDGLHARSIGPATMGGRVTDLAVIDTKPDVYYVATAGGGVWKTTDGGATLTPLFDNQPTMSIGAVAVCQGSPEVVYVGTGEGNPRNSVSPGMGVFKSTDGGKSWAHCGLANTHHIGRVVVHPKNPDVAYVAALGHFWGPNKDRGVYKTTDGGKTWTMSHFIDENTGFVDIQMDPSDPETLYACAWEQRRDGFSGGNPKTGTGPKGGIFKTTDGGKTWARLTGGLPANSYGRGGISIYKKDPNVVFAVVQTDKTVTTVQGQLPTPLDKDKQPGKPGPVETGGIFRSADKGKTWTKVNDLCPRPFYYGQIRVDPTDELRVYVLGVGFYVSNTGGATFTGQQLGGVHSDHHALWVNPADPDHVILGNDGGLYVSKDKTKTFTPMRGFVVSQFYGVAVDDRIPYRVYGGLQDNGSWGAPIATAYTDGVTIADWQRIGGGDGFQCAVDPKDPDTVYAESQYGVLYRVNVSIPPNMKGRSVTIRPPGPKGMGGNRWNWNAPILLSPHDSKTLYYGGQFLFKSENRGDKWEKISPDLTRGPKDAPVTNNGHTILATAQSPVKDGVGVLWVGTDDGNVWVTKDGGKEWADVTDKVPGVPKDRAISKIECSHYDAGTAYLAIDRHRNDDFKPYIFKTTDYGQTWVPIVNGLPDGAYVGVVRQSSRNKDLLFAGTELGLYVSLDGGKMWHHLNKTGLPAAVRVDDLVIHPRERDLVIGTHGRGIWIMDISPLEQLTPDILKADAHLFDVRPVTLLPQKERPAPEGKQPPIPKTAFAAKNPDQAVVVNYLLGEKRGSASVRLLDTDGNVVGLAGVSGKPEAGLKRATIEVRKPGEYTVELTVGGVKQTKKVKVAGDPVAKADQ